MNIEFFYYIIIFIYYYFFHHIIICQAYHEDPPLREACGVFGMVVAKGAVREAPEGMLAQTLVDGMVALQHRCGFAL